MTGRVEELPEPTGQSLPLPERWAPPEERETIPGVSWAWQAITGVLLLVLLTLHMIANHFVVQGGLRDYQQVIDYITNPIILPLETLFLVVVSWHGLLGLRAVIFDFGLSARAERVVTRVFLAIWVVTVIYGVSLLAILVTRR